MKRLLPLVAVAGVLAACGDNEPCHHRDRNGYCHNEPHHGSSADALSDRSLGNSRGAHNEKNYGDYNTKDNMYRPAPPAYVVAPAPVPPHGHPVPPHAVAVPSAAPAPGYRPDGTYVVRPDGTYLVAPVYEERGYQHKHSDDALSDRPLGSSRGAHNEPMTAKDADNDGNYDYVPYYTPRRY